MIRASEVLRAAAFVPLLLPARAGDPPAQQTPAAIKAYRALALSRASAAVPSETESQYLFELGSGAIRPLLGVLETEIVPRVDGDTQPPALEGEKKLDARQEAVIVAALAKFGRKPLVPPMTRELAKPSSVRFRADCLRLLEAVGDREDLRLICQVVAPADANGDIEPALGPGFVEAATSILSRDPTALLAVGELWREIPSATRLCLYRALGELASPLSVSILGLRLGREAAEDPFVLADLARASKKVPLPVEGSVLELVRPYLKSEEPVVVQGAAACLGGFQDEGCIGDLIELLSHADGGVRGAAHQALRSIGGVGLWADVPRWTSWYEGEREWHEATAPGRIESIRNGRVGERARAIADLTEHPLYRKEIAVELQEVLPNAEDEIRLLGIRALGQLGAATAVPFLESCTLDPEPGLAAEARAALGRIQAQRDHPGGAGS
jgi:HEAT repeat protein